MVDLVIRKYVFVVASDRTILLHRARCADASASSTGYLKYLVAMGDLFNMTTFNWNFKLAAPALLCWLGYLDGEHLRASERQRGLCSLGVRSISSARSDCVGSLSLHGPYGLNHRYLLR